MIVIILIALSFRPLLISNGTTTLSSNILYVDDDGGADYTSIQDAINHASEGDVIKILEGTYHENIVIDKQLSLNGEQSKVQVIIASNQPVSLIADHINLIRITIQSTENSSQALSITSDHNVIFECVIKNDYSSTTISLEGNDNELTDCFILGSLELFRAHDNNIWENTIGSILIDHSHNNQFLYNCICQIQNNGIEHIDSENTIIRNNLIYQNQIGILIERSYNILIKENDFMKNTKNTAIDEDDHHHWKRNFWGSSENEYSFPWIFPFPYPIRGLDETSKRIDHDFFPSMLPNYITLLFLDK